MEKTGSIESQIKAAEKELANLNERKIELQYKIKNFKSLQNSIAEEQPSFNQGPKTNINSVSPEQRKITLFRSLFRGREDVFPKRFESKRTGKSGYQPVCRNEWIRPFCQKPKIRCAECDNRDFEPVTNEIVRFHLIGFDPGDRYKREFVMGVYPMLTDETCWFLAVDFDKELWMKDVSAYLETCRTYKVPATVEISRSGQGGHIWIFFSEPIAAKLVRQLGAFMLTQAMEKRPEMGFESYDRFFPSQDTLPKGGFGNLIALPLQKKPRDEGNALFVDEKFSAYTDQWAFLYALQRMSLVEVQSVVDKSFKRGGVLGVKFVNTEEDESEPWLHSPSGKRPATKIVGSLPDEVELVLSKGVVDDIVADYGYLIVDECHHISARSFEIAARQTKAKYVTGLSATVIRKDGHHPIIFMNCGPVRHKVDDKEQAAKRPFAHKVIARKTKYRLPLSSDLKGYTAIHQIYDYLIHNVDRNQLIVKDILKMVSDGRFPVVITERVVHLEKLKILLEDKIDNVIVMKGGMGAKQRKKAMNSLESLSESAEKAVLATGKYLGEGFDDKRFDTLFLTLPISWRGIIVQYAGRLHRAHYSKKEVMIFDYADVEVPMLARMFQRRLTGYRAIGYEVLE